MKIRWSPTAVSDLESIRGYIAKDSPTTALRVAARIREAAVLHGRQDWPEQF